MATHVYVSTTHHAGVEVTTLLELWEYLRSLRRKCTLIAVTAEDDKRGHMGIHTAPPAGVEGLFHNIKECGWLPDDRRNFGR